MQLNVQNFSGNLSQVFSSQEIGLVSFFLVFVFETHFLKSDLSQVQPSKFL